MRGKLARQLRRAIYEDKDYRDRMYGQIKGKGQIITIAPGHKVLSDRRKYQRLKKTITSK